MQPQPSEVIEIRVRIQHAIYHIKERLSEAEKTLTELQEICPHVNRHQQTEYDFTAHWCDDCGKNWSTR